MGLGFGFVFSFVDDGCLSLPGENEPLIRNGLGFGFVFSFMDDRCLFLPGKNKPLISLIYTDLKISADQGSAVA